jgi:hypothetical protein
MHRIGEAGTQRMVLLHAWPRTNVKNSTFDAAAARLVASR